MVTGGSRWRGPGHCAILQDKDGEKLVYHAYDADCARHADTADRSSDLGRRRLARQSRHPLISLTSRGNGSIFHFPFVIFHLVIFLISVRGDSCDFVDHCFG